MSVAAFEVLLRDVLMQAPHCPDVTGLHALRLATIDFCTDTLWWKHVGAPQDVTAGETVYEADVPSQTEVVAVTAVWVKDTRLEPLGYGARYKWSARNLEGRSGPARFFTCPSPNEVQLHPIPDVDVDDGLVVASALCPTRTATVADAQLLSRWSDALTNGALYRVYQIPNQPFSNLEESKRRYALFRQDVTQAKIAANKASTLTSLSVKPRKS